MDKNMIKKYAIWARRELISRVSQKAYQYGIRENEIVDANADSVDGKLLTDSEKKERQALITQVKKKGFEQVMEEVAYTWFNRFSALRFMEVNGYIPSHVRVFTDEENNFKPQIITEAIHLELDGLDLDKVYAYVEADNKDELFKYLLITQCNAFNKILPGMFQKIADYTELLFPDNLLREGSVIEQMVALIPKDDWKDAVQIIGWLYQYYNSEPKDTVFANLKKNIKITKENIPAATQLFTPDWIVRYMVENSLGRLWLEGHPNDELKSEWKYYLDETEQEGDVQTQLAKICEEYKSIKPEEIRLIDPCMGSGHILAYAFDVLMQIYEAYGFNQRDAAKSIVENNIFGLDIDERAAQLAYFAVMMKARQYDRRFFSRGAQPHVYAICESNNLDKFCVDYFVSGDANLKVDMQILIDEFYDAKEYGSIINVTNVDFDAMYARFEKISDDINIAREATLNELLPFVQVAQAMAQKYHAVVTNPPYKSLADCGEKLNNFVKKLYPDSKNDLSTVFMEKTMNMCEDNGFMAMINIPVWMSKSSFEKLRYKLLHNHSFVNMLHCGRGIFGSDFGTTSFVVSKCHYPNYLALFRKLFEELGNVDSIEQKEKWFFEGKGICYAYPDKFLKIASYPIAYWVSDRLLTILNECKPLKDYAAPRKGLTTGDNDIFTRLWFEVSILKFGINRNAPTKWYPMTKGGDFRRWYGNNSYVVNWENAGFEICNFKDENGKLRSRPQNVGYYFHEGISWNDTTATGKIAFRYQSNEFIPNASGPCVYAENNLLYLFGLLNSVVSQTLLEVLAPNMKFEVGQMALVPIIMNLIEVEEINELVKNNVKIVKSDWDSFEISWDFIRHPLVVASYEQGEQLSDGIHSKEPGKAFSLLSVIYRNWEKKCDDRFTQLKANEEKLNRIFIDIYGLQDELTTEIDDRDVTVYKVDLQRDVKSLISYAVGCMFGRYSLDVDGVAFAGGSWDASKYKTFSADEDNIIPICDDEYFQDDIVGRFVKFIETVYGKETLDDNLKFIADALGGKGSPKEVIRNYFLNEFYVNHCTTYSVTGSGKRPIYWLFDSGNKNGFKALIYMHRYQPDTIARMRTDYVHEQQERYRTAMVHVEQRINDASTSERVKLNKQLTKLKDQATEIKTFEEKIHHLADQMIRIDLDDGVKKNYDIFKDVLAKIK